MPATQQYYNISSHSINKILYHFHAAPFAVLLGLSGTFLQNLTLQFCKWYTMSINPAYFSSNFTHRSFHVYFQILLRAYWVPSL